MNKLANARSLCSWALLVASAACAASGGETRSTGEGGSPSNGGTSSSAGSTASGSGGTSQVSGGQSTAGGQSAAGGQSNLTGGAAQGGASGGSASLGGTMSSAGGALAAAGAPPTIGGYAVVIPPTAVGATTPSCGVQAFKRERKPTEIILVLDRSASMKDTPSGGTMQKWQMVLPAITGVIRTTDNSISWGLKLYPEGKDTGSCVAATIVPLIHVPVAPVNATNVIAAINATAPEGDGTPTGDAIKYATEHLKARNNTNPKFILLATDGDPSCPSSNATPYAVTAIADALKAGFPTFVVGVDTSKDSSVNNLNQMAVAGGRPRATTGTDMVYFYLASTQAALTTALQTITGDVASCVFDLDPPPPVPDNIAVDFSGQRTARDPTRQNGWEYTNANHTQLEVFGSWCDRIKNEAMNQVEIKYGCPNQPIPLPG
ncbi:MAG: VWA domain-containing protein [Polyangiaceae bacterium]